MIPSVPFISFLKFIIDLHQVLSWNSIVYTIHLFGVTFFCTFSSPVFIFHFHHHFSFTFLQHVIPFIEFYFISLLDLLLVDFRNIFVFSLGCLKILIIFLLNCMSGILSALFSLGAISMGLVIFLRKLVVLVLLVPDVF